MPEGIVDNAKRRRFFAYHLGRGGANPVIRLDPSPPSGGAPHLVRVGTTHAYAQGHGREPVGRGLAGQATATVCCKITAATMGTLVS